MRKPRKRPEPFSVDATFYHERLVELWRKDPYRLGKGSLGAFAEAADLTVATLARVLDGKAERIQARTARKLDKLFKELMPNQNRP